MSHTITPYEHHVATDSIVWPFDVEKDGSPKDLANDTIEYYVCEGEGDPDDEAILDDSDSAVSIDKNAGGQTGRLEITIGRGQLDRGGEVLWHRVRVKAGADGQRTFTGPFPINQA